MDGFNFSRQHDARILQGNSTTTILSLLDNAADVFNATADVSSAIVVALHHAGKPQRAEILRRYDRPDGQLSRLRGNMQILPSGNVVVGWSDNSYMTEFTEDGMIVAEASFASHRFVSYRGYKYAWVGNPGDPPVVRGFVYGASPRSTTTVLYVSWNGATEVATWRFWGSSINNTDADFRLLGSVPRTGFETSFQAEGGEKYVFAEAMASDGASLGRSWVEATLVHPGIGAAVSGDHGIGGIYRLPATETYLGMEVKYTGVMAAETLEALLRVALLVIVLVVLLRTCLSRWGRRRQPRSKWSRV